jgi:hypothetical protein
VRYREHRERKAERSGRVLKQRRVVPNGQKFCPRCEQTLPVTSFGSNRSSRDGYTSYCRACHNAVGRETKVRLYGGTREYHLRHRYGITGADVEGMVAAQGGVCPGCGGEPQHVDHDHNTGKVRGVLCFNCNQALGNVRDDISVLLGLIGYLAKHQERQPSPVADPFWEIVPRFDVSDLRHAA